MRPRLFTAGQARRVVALVNKLGLSEAQRVLETEGIPGRSGVKPVNVTRMTLNNYRTRQAA